MSSPGVAYTESNTEAIAAAAETFPLSNAPANRNRELHWLELVYTGTVAGLTLQVFLNDGTNRIPLTPPVGGITSGQPVRFDPAKPVYYGELSQIEVDTAGATASDTLTLKALSIERTP